MELSPFSKKSQKQNSISVGLKSNVKYDTTIFGKEAL